MYLAFFPRITECERKGATKFASLSLLHNSNKRNMKMKIREMSDEKDA